MKRGGVQVIVRSSLLAESGEVAVDSGPALAFLRIKRCSDLLAEYAVNVCSVSICDFAKE
ncbi:hypothetical protein SAMN05720354_11553 [Nitrosospira sp. Nsp1]|nr:hypothetical protein SAMN05720354_11553 [Nitrosospira sp. Nsp1]